MVENFQVFLSRIPAIGIIFWKEVFVLSESLYSRKAWPRWTTKFFFEHTIQSSRCRFFKKGLSDFLPFDRFGAIHRKDTHSARPSKDIFQRLFFADWFFRCIAPGRGKGKKSFKRLFQTIFPLLTGLGSILERSKELCTRFSPDFQFLFFRTAHPLLYYTIWLTCQCDHLLFTWKYANNSFYDCCHCQWVFGE